MLRSKKGDFVLTIDPARAGGADLRIVVEAKDRAMSLRAIRDELREAKENRGAAVAVVVFSPDHAPPGIAPFDVRAGDVYCVVDPADPDPATLDAAVRLARLHALAGLRDTAAEIDSEAIRAALGGSPRGARGDQGHQVDAHGDLRSSMGVQATLDALRDGDPGPDRRGRGGDPAVGSDLIAAGDRAWG